MRPALCNLPVTTRGEPTGNDTWRRVGVHRATPVALLPTRRKRFARPFPRRWPGRTRRASAAPVRGSVERWIAGSRNRVDPGQRRCRRRANSATPPQAERTKKRTPRPPVLSCVLNCVLALVRPDEPTRRCPPHDRAAIARLMHEHSFATLVTPAAPELRRTWSRVASRTHFGAREPALAVSPGSR